MVSNSCSQTGRHPNLTAIRHHLQSQYLKDGDLHELGQGSQSRALVQCLVRLSSGKQSLQTFRHDTTAMLDKLVVSNIQEVGPAVLSKLLQSMAGAIGSSLSLVDVLDQQDLSSGMQTSVSLLEGLVAWMLQHGEHLQHMGLSVVCSPMTQVIDQALLLSYTAMFSRRWLDALGNATFQSCTATIRGVVKDLASLAYSLIVFWWPELEASGCEDADLERLQQCKALTATLGKRLMDLGVTATDAMLANNHTETPREMISLATVNVAWGAVMKVLTNLPGSAHSQLIDASIAIKAIEHNLGYLEQWLQHFVKPPYDTNKMKVLRFWTMHLTKLVGTYALCASQFWTKLANITISIYQFMAKRQVEGSPGDQACLDLEQHLAPKLVQLMLMCLEEEAQESIVEAGAPGIDTVLHKISLLTTPCQDDEDHFNLGPAVSATQLQHTLGRLQLVAAMLYRAPLLSSSIGLLAMARQLMPWMLMASAAEAYLLTSHEFHVRGGHTDLVCSAAISLVAACSNFASSHDDHLAEEAWQECLSQLYNMGCSAHPAVQHLASTALACLMATFPPEVAAQQLVQLGSLVSDLAASEAVAEIDAVASIAAGNSVAWDHLADSIFVVGPGASASAACRASHLLHTLSQAAPEGASSAAYHDLQLDGSHCEAASSDLGSSLAAALLCGSFAYSRDAQDVTSWLTGLARRVHELCNVLEAVNGDQQRVGIASAHLATVLMLVVANAKRAQQLVQDGARGADSADMAMSPAAAAAAEILQAWASSQLPQPVAPPLHVMWALRVVSRAGSSLSVQVLGSLLPALMVLKDQPACAAHVAAVANHFGCLDPAPVDLFHSLLHSHSWVLLHEALRSLVSISKTSTAGDFRLLIPQDLFVPSGAGQPATFKLGRAYKSYLERQPSPATIQSAFTHGDTAKEGRSLLKFAGASVRQLQHDFDAAAATVSDRLQAGLQALAQCMHAAASAASTSEQGQQPSLLAQLLPQNKAQLESVVQSLAGLESSLSSLHAAAHSGALFSGVAKGEGRSQLHSHTSFLLGELASASSKIRSLQEIVHALR